METRLLTTVAMVLVALACVPARAVELPKLPVEFGECPRETLPFLRYVVQRRAAEGVNRVVTDPKDPKYGTVYGGAPEDANIAWIAAAAYKPQWSRYHKSADLRARAVFLVDALARIRADGKWDDGGLNAYFGVHSFAWAVLSWLETGDVDAERAETWRRAVAAAAEHAMECMHYGPYRPSALAGQYANPEIYYMAGLAAAWKVTGEKRYRDEAALALRRYDAWLFPGGGMAYFFRSGPQHGYQHMVTKGIALYWDLTEDPVALDFLKRMAPYFPNVQHRSGLITDAEQPHLKHTFWNAVNPGAPAMLACALGDGANRWAADVAAGIWADGVHDRLPSFLKKNPPGFQWYNYHLITYAAAALRLMERRPLPEPAPLPARRVFPDDSFRGVRSHWDDFAAAVGTRHMNDSLAGAYLADPKEPRVPLGAALDGVFFEALEGDRGPTANPTLRYRKERRCLEWEPFVTTASTEGFAAVGCLSRLCAPYWGDMPFLPDEVREAEVSQWAAIQHWAVWRDRLIGLGSLRCGADGGDPATADLARVRWRLSPQGRELAIEEQGEDSWRFRYGGLRVEMTRLAETGGFRFATEETEPEPRAAWSPTLSRAGPWKAGDFVNVATVASPAGAEGAVHIRALPLGAAALLVEPDGKTATLWIANLCRHQVQYLFDVPPGASARPFKRNVELTAVPPGLPASSGLSGAESIVWVLTAQAPIDARALLAGIRLGKARWGAPPAGK